MELILDTADASAVRELDSLLEVSGVTTNPTIITRSGRSPEQVIDDLLAVLRDEQKLFVQTIATDFEGIMADARAIASLRADNVYVKIPVTRAGMRAVKAAKAEGLKVLATSIYSADQGFLAAMNGADYLAPYVNRMCSFGDGVAQVMDLIEMLRANGMPSRVVAASFKNSHQVHELVCAGIQAVTVPPSVAWDMLGHPGTDSAVEEFSAAWREAYGRDRFSAT